MSNPNQVVVSQVSDVTTVEISTRGPQGPTVPDGDKGDVTVSSNGTAFTINNNAVTSAKILDGTIVDADINASAAIALSKLATGALPTAITVTSANISDLSIVNADVNGSAAIEGSKLQASSGSNSGTMSAADFTKLAGIETGATADQTASEIKTAYESNSDTNAFTDALLSKLNGIESNATADQTKSDIDALGIAASTATTLATARDIGGVSFNGSANIDLPGVNTAGNQNTSGNAATATTLQTSRTIAGTSFDGSANIDISYTNLTNKLSVGDGGLTQNNFTDALKTKLDGVETGATSDQTAAEIKTLLNSDGIVNAQIDANAAIAGSKISPNFVAQNIFTTGTVTSGDMRILDATPTLTFTDTDDNPDFSIGVGSLALNFLDITNNVVRFRINSDGHVDVLGNLDVGAGLDVTGNITVTGTVDNVDIATRDTLFGGLTSSSGVLTDGVTATTQSASDNSTKVATTAYTDTAVANLVDSAPGTLNTLNELAAALGDDPNFATTVTNSIATKLPLAGGTLIGNLTISKTNPRIIFTDTNDNPDYLIDVNAGHFLIFDATNNANRILINSDGHIDLLANVDISNGLDVTGDITTTGQLQISSTLPTILLNDTDSENDFEIRNQNGSFIIRDIDNPQTRYTIASSGMIHTFHGAASFSSNLDVGAGIDVTGAITGTGDLTIDTNTLHVDSSNNRVGIGTTSPSSLLHVAGAGIPTIKLEDTDTAGGFAHFEVNGAALFIESYDEDSTPGAILFKNASSEAMRIRSDGNVGIGTSSPSTKFEVQTAASERVQFLSNGSNEQPRIDLIRDSGIDYSIINAIGAYQIKKGSNLIYQYASDSHRFSIDGSEKARIDSSGNVMIGTTTKGHSNADDLTVNNSGNCGITIRSGSSNDGNIFFADADSDTIGTLKYDHTNNAFRINTNGAERMRIDSSGNVGIGTTSPQVELVVRGSTPQVLLEPTSDVQNCRFQFATTDGTIQSSIMGGGSDGAVIKFLQGFSEKMRIDSSGNVGIGTSTSSPAAKLTVHTTTTTNSSSQLFRITTANGALFGIETDETTSNPTWKIGGLVNNGAAEPLAFYQLGSEVARIDSSGNVGIGIASPSRGPFHVHENSSGSCQIHLTNSDTGSTSSDGLTIFTDTNSSGIFSRENTAFRMATNNTERMRIDSSGRVGIGTTSPAAVLELVASTTGRSYSVSSSTELVVERNGNSQISIIAANNSDSILHFGDTDDENVGFIGYDHADNSMRFRTNTTERMRLDSSGNLGIGTTSPDNLLHLFESNTTQTADASSQLVIEKNSNSGITILSGNVHNGRILFGDSGDNDIGQIDYDHNNNNLRFVVNANERLRIDSSGRMLLGTTSSVQNGVLEVRSAATSGATVAFANTNASYTGSVMLLHAERETTNSSYDFIGCRIESPAPGVQAFRFEVADDGDVRNVNGFIGTISDISLKENIVDANSQWNDFKNLKFRSFNFKESTGFSTHKQIGLVAQEVETVCPNLVRIGKEDENTKERHKYVGTSILYMKGMKALQEAIAKIEVLETKVAALEAA